MYLKEERGQLIPKFIQKLFGKSLVRYALVGGIGIPVNLLALDLFLNLFGYYRPHPLPFIYSLAYICAFEVSTVVNFVLNQTFTYRDQMQGIHGLSGWIKRALKAQSTSISASLLSFVIAQVLKYGFNVNPFISSFVSIVVAFFYNYAISKRFVFRPVSTSNSQSAETVEENNATISSGSLTGD